MEVKGRFEHFNINVLDLEKSIAFYNKALGVERASSKGRGRRFFYIGLFNG